MSLIVSASWSNSSPRPDSRTRWVKSPAAIAAAVAETLASVRRNRLRTTSAPTEAMHQHDQQRPQQRVGQQRAQLRAHLHVAADQQVEAARQVVALHQRQRAHAGALDRQLVPAAALRHAVRPVLEVAGDALPGRIDQQIDRIVIDVLRQPVLDGQHQRRRCRPAAKRSDRPCASALDRRLGLPVEQAGGRPPQEQRQRAALSASSSA